MLAGVFRAINDSTHGRLKSRNVHSEIVFSLSPNNNVSRCMCTLTQFPRCCPLHKLSQRDSHLRRGRHFSVGELSFQSSEDLLKCHSNPACCLFHGLLSIGIVPYQVRFRLTYPSMTPWLLAIMKRVDVAVKDSIDSDKDREACLLVL